MEGAIATIIAAVLAIIGSYIGGKVGANATLRAMKETIAANDRARRETERQERRGAFDALVRELHLNVEYAGVARVDDAWVPFQTTALLQAQRHLATLPAHIYAVIQ